MPRRAALMRPAGAGGKGAGGPVAHRLMTWPAPGQRRVAGVPGRRSRPMVTARVRPGPGRGGPVLPSRPCRLHAV